MAAICPSLQHVGRWAPQRKGRSQGWRETEVAKILAISHKILYRAFMSDIEEARKKIRELRELFGEAALKEAIKAELQPEDRTLAMDSLTKLTRLGDSEHFKDYLSKNRWKDRRERGWPWRTDVFEFIETTYKDWLGKGLVQADLRLDEQLYDQLHQRLTQLDPTVRKMKLEQLKLPSGSDARLALLTDPEERQLLIHSRQWNRMRMTKARQADGQIGNTNKGIESAFLNATDKPENAEKPSWTDEMKKTKAEGRRNPSQFIRDEYADELSAGTLARKDLPLDISEAYASWIRPSRHPEDDLNLYTQKRTDLSGMKPEDALKHIRRQKDEASKRSREQQKMHRSKRPHRRQEELPNPNLPPDHEANKIQPLLRARVEPDFYAAVERWREQKNWTKKEMFEKVFGDAMRRAPFSP